MTMPLLVGLDGKDKMSKSKDNYVGISESPTTIFGKIMSLPDEQMMDYYNLVSSFDSEEVKEFQLEMNEGQINPKSLKEKLAKNIIKQLYNSEAADKAQLEFKQVFSENKIPNHIEEFIWSDNTLVSPQDLFTETKLLASKSAVTRMLNNGGIRVDSQKLTTADEAVHLKDGMIIQVGKRKFLKIILKK